MNHDDDVLEKIIKGDWKIAYGYFKVFDNKNVYVRHCCFLDVLSAEMIDPTITLLSTFKARQELKYWLIRAFDYEEYINVINKHYRTPALNEYLHDETETLRVEMMQQGLLPID